MDACFYQRYFHVYLCCEYAKQIILPVNRTVKVTNVKPGLSSHVNYINLSLLINARFNECRADDNFNAYVAIRDILYSHLKMQKSNKLQCVRKCQVSFERTVIY